MIPRSEAGEGGQGATHGVGRALAHGRGHSWCSRRTASRWASWWRWAASRRDRASWSARRSALRLLRSSSQRPRRRAWRSRMLSGAPSGGRAGTVCGGWRSCSWTSGGSVDMVVSFEAEGWKVGGERAGARSHGGGASRRRVREKCAADIAVENLPVGRVLPGAADQPIVGKDAQKDPVAMANVNPPATRYARRGAVVPVAVMCIIMATSFQLLTRFATLAHRQEGCQQSRACRAHCRRLRPAVRARSGRSDTVDPVLIG